jgi:bacterioferritin
METTTASVQVLGLLNRALARELQVSIQYMLQHAIGTAQQTAGTFESSSGKQGKFVASNALYFFPGNNLKKIAITEMRHAEAIAERIVILGGEPTSQPARITLDTSISAMLENDRDQEVGAIELYKKIIEFAERENDGVTKKLFERILADEVKHHQTFSELLK